jgi:glucose/galactose transporter
MITVTGEIKNVEVQKKRLHPMIIIGVLFFIFGFITWVNSVLIPYLQIACELNNFQAYLVAFAFYISYFVMATPSGWVLRRTGYKKGMSLGLLFVAAGSFLFIPASMYRTYPVFLLGLFIQGAGLALLQTAANPYVTILGPIESGAKRMSIMGICNGIAGIVAPAILGIIILNNTDELTAQIAQMDIADKVTALNQLAQRIILPYIVIGLILLLLAFWVWRSGLPEMDEPTEEEVGLSEKTNKTNIFQFPYLLIGVFVLFLYVGVEAIAGNTVIQYATSQGIPMSAAKFFTSYVLTGMLVGYLVGILCIPKYFSQKMALKCSAGFGILCVFGALFTHGFTSVVFIIFLGLANSLMYPSIWPLAIDGLGKFTKIGSSLLVMAICGGALLPLAYGWLADHFNTQQAYWVVIPCYLMIGYYAILGHKVGRKKFNVNK